VFKLVYQNCNGIKLFIGWSFHDGGNERKLFSFYQKFGSPQVSVQKIECKSYNVTGFPLLCLSLAEIRRPHASPVHITKKARIYNGMISVVYYAIWLCLLLKFAWI
jgi:hypothetical protein